MALLNAAKRLLLAAAVGENPRNVKTGTTITSGMERPKRRRKKTKNIKFIDNYHPLHPRLSDENHELKERELKV